MLWTEGSTNPLTNIEQLTYLIFMKGLDESELEKEQDNELLGIDDYKGIFPEDKQYIRWHRLKIWEMLDKYIQSFKMKHFPL